MLGFLLAAVLFETMQNGIGMKVERVDAESRPLKENCPVDPAKSVFLSVELKVPYDRKATMPDLRDRVVGFSLVDDIEKPTIDKDGSSVQVTEWQLVPEPCADVYKIRPFVVKASPKIYRAQSDEGKYSFIGGPVTFEKPAVREPVTGGMEVDLELDLPSYIGEHVGRILLAVLSTLAALMGLFVGVRHLRRRVKEHFMSPIERAWAELDRLLGKGLPGRGRYKDFYVELTMVVRRYIQRKYGIQAPHLTTEEFFAELVKSNNQTIKQSNDLQAFLESADMVKFAGVEATPEMADAATDSARGYLKSDAHNEPQVANPES